MKTFFFSFILFFLFQPSILAEDIPLVTKDEAPLVGRPRMPMKRLITAEIENDVVFLLFSEDILPSEITIINESTGESYYCIANQQSISIIVSGTPGLYRIEIQTPSGTVYCGNFIL